MGRRLGIFTPQHREKTTVGDPLLPLSSKKKRRWGTPFYPSAQRKTTVGDPLLPLSPLTRIAHVKSESGSWWVVEMDFGDQIPKFEHDQLAQLENGRSNLDRTIQLTPQTIRTNQSCVFRQNGGGMKIRFGHSPRKQPSTFAQVDVAKPSGVLFLERKKSFSIVGKNRWQQQQRQKQRRFHTSIVFPKTLLLS